MKLIKRLAALALCAALTLTPALAAGAGDGLSTSPSGEDLSTPSAWEGLPVVTAYPGYIDVVEAAWFHDPIKLCTETGLMQGDGDGTFAPDRTLNVAEVATVAARLHSLLHGGDGKIEQPSGAIYWWTGAIDYMSTLAKERENTAAAGLLENPMASISRAGCLLVLSLVADETFLPPINQVSALPDTDDPAVLMFYRAGILNGMDKYGTFAGDLTLKRSECAAMLARVATPSLRLTGEPADFSMFTAAGTTPNAIFFPGVNAETYLTKVNDLIRRLEVVCAGNNMEFNWLNTYGDQTFLEYVKFSAMIELNVDPSLATEAYKSFDLQVYYSKLIDLTGGL